MQRRPIRTNYIRKKRRFVFVLILLLLIGLGLIILVTLSHLSKKALFISPITKNSIKDEKRVEQLLHEAEIPFSSVFFLDYYCIVTLSDGGEVILSLKKNIEKQIASLQPILKQLTIDGKRFNRIDFRFDKPLVVYE